MIVPAGAAALAGLLHATAAGAIVLGGLALAVPDAVVAGSPLEAVAHAVAFGLASLRVPLESGGVQGTFAPLSGLALTLWGLASAARRGPGRASRIQYVAVTGAAFAVTCAGAAAAIGSLATIEPSLPGAALAGLAWGSLGAAFGTYLGVLRPDAAGWNAGVQERLRSLRPPPGPPGVVPGAFVALVAFALAAVWFFVAVVVGLAGGPAREFAGGVLLAVSVAPNAAAAFVALGLGSTVDVVLDGTLLAEPLRESLSLWDGPPYVLALVVVPAAATLAGGRVAAAVAPGTPSIVRGLRNGAVLGAVLVAAGWAGSLAATAAAAGDRVTVRLGFPWLTTFALALAWGVAGAYLGPLLPWPRRGSRVDAP